MQDSDPIAVQLNMEIRSMGPIGKRFYRTYWLSGTLFNNYVHLLKAAKCPDLPPLIILPRGTDTPRLTVLPRVLTCRP